MAFAPFSLPALSSRGHLDFIPVLALLVESGLQLTHFYFR
jgi:hypothetical protein